MSSKYLALAVMFFTAITFASESASGASENLKACHDDPKLVDACFSFRGRLSYYNGAPTVRIWRVGTKRILGVTEHLNTNGYATIPKNLLEKMTFETDMFADFMICPYTKEDSESMQLICVDSASKITLKPR